MSQKRALKAIFDKYAGKEIRHPDRLTCDIDPVMDGLAQELRAAGFILGAHQEKGQPQPITPQIANLVIAEYERGADKKLHLTGKFKL